MTRKTRFIAGDIPETLKMSLKNPNDYVKYGYYSLVYQLCIIQRAIQCKPLEDLLRILDDMDKLFSIYEFQIDIDAEYWVGNDDETGTLIKLAYSLVEDILAVAKTRLDNDDEIPSELSPARRPNFPQWVHEIFRKWLVEHLDKPYPTEKEKRKLMQETNLTMAQVNNYFINARRRVVPMLKEEYQ